MCVYKSSFICKDFHFIILYLHAAFMAWVAIPKHLRANDHDRIERCLATARTHQLR